MNTLDEVYKELKKYETKENDLTLVDDELLLKCHIDGQNYLLSAIDDQLISISKINDNNGVLVYAHPNCDEIYNYYLDVMLNKIDILEEIKVEVIPLKKKIALILTMVGTLLISIFFTGIICMVFDTYDKYIISILLVIFYVLFSILLNKVPKKPKSEKSAK
jgi:hypothetical protein